MEFNNDDGHVAVSNKLTTLCASATQHGSFASCDERIIAIQCSDEQKKPRETVW